MLSDKLLALRKAAGLTQTALAERLGTTKQTVWKYEKGIVTNIPLDRLRELAAALGCSVEFLIGDEADKKAASGCAAEGLSGVHAELIEVVKGLSPEDAAAALRFLKR